MQTHSKYCNHHPHVAVRINSILVYYIQATFYKSFLIDANGSVIKVTLLAYVNTNKSGLIIHTMENVF